MPGDWLSLSAVAKILGVHPSTVRNWADQGQLPVQRTQGGHRRFKRSDVELWTQSHKANGPQDVDLMIQSALGRTRFHVSEGKLAEEPWFQKLDDDARNKYRRSGRAILQGITAYISSDDTLAAAEARTTGYEYATIGRRCGLSSVEATNAFLFFRNMLVESMIAVYEGASINSPHAWSDMLRKINAFTDQVLIALLENYQVYGDKQE